MMAVEDKESYALHLVRGGILYVCAKINVNKCVINPTVSSDLKGATLLTIFLPFDTVPSSVFCIEHLTVIV